MSAITVEAIGAKPCPFCGSEEVFCEGDTPEGLWGVECGNDDCAASGPRGFDTPTEAISKWNMREHGCGENGR